MAKNVSMLNLGFEPQWRSEGFIESEGVTLKKKKLVTISIKFLSQINKNSLKKG